MRKFTFKSLLSSLQGGVGGRLFSFFVALFCAATLFAESGTCGDNLTWDLTDGVLTISGTGDMTNYSYDSDAPWYSSRASIKEVSIGNSVTSIGDHAFRGCSSLTSVTIPNSVTRIGNYAFDGCSSLTSVTLPNSVTSIGVEAFYSCSSLTSITLPNSVTSIGSSAFSYCTSLTSIDVAADNANYCSVDGVLFNKDKTTLVAYPGGGPSTYTIPNSVTRIGNYAFSGCRSLTSVTIPNSVTSIGERAFSYCSSLTSVTIPNSVTSIGDGAFARCTSLTSITIGNSVTSIGDEAFFGCTSLTSVTIGNSVTSIGEGAFYGCTSLTSVTIPNSVTSIGGGAFEYCSSLTSVTIPNSVTSIGAYAFYECTSLTSVTNEATTPQAITANDNVFYNVPISKIPLYVPAQSIDLYKAAAVWKKFASILPISAENVETTDVTITPDDNSANIVWPTIEGAASYDLVIRDKDGNAICTLRFDEEGRLLLIVFHMPNANREVEQTQAAGFSFTITGLNSGTTYNYTLTAKDNNDNVIDTKSGTFTTTGGDQAIDQINSSSLKGRAKKVLRNGQVFILRGDKTYTVTGQEVK